MKKITALFLAVAVMVLSLSGCGLIFGEKDIELSETSINMIVGDSAVLSVTDESNKPVPKLSWSSSDSSVVTVNDGSLMAKAAGTAVVTVTTEGGISKSCNVTVNDKEITKITLDSQTIKLKAGKTVQLNAKFDPPDATKTNLTWSSSDSTVAMVNSEGFVTGVSKGVVNIYCRADNNIEASCTVTVEAKASNNSSSKSANKDSGSNTYIYYGHFNPSYVYSASDFVFPESSTRKLSRSEIEATLYNMSGYPVADSFAQDAINEIYARNGYVFKTDSIRAYYESKPWYYADPSFTTSDFNSYENYNISLLTDYS